MKKPPDATNWHGLDLAAAIIWNDGDDLDVYLFDILVNFDVLELGGRLCSWSAMAYVDDDLELIADPQPDAQRCLDAARALVRGYASAALYDAWLLREAIRTGAQPALPF